MKKFMFGALILGLLSACNTDSLTNQNETPMNQDEVPAGSAAKRSCLSEEIREKMLQKNPALRQKMNEIEAGAERYANNLALGKVLADGTVEIPVVFNVIYNTATQNVSDARIAEQIAVLNADYGGTNSDVTKIPSAFQPSAAGDVKIRFKLVATNRKQSSKTGWRSDLEEMKKASTGGITATDVTKNMNIWVVNSILDENNQPGTLGYAYYPEHAGQWYDGLVIGYNYIGKTGASAPFNLGRTVTHEVGHYLNLPHLWGSSDAGCQTDYSNDTPLSPGPNYGTPTYPLNRSCGGVSRSQMFMNYMDYVDDKAMFMFSANQKTRMQAVVSASGPRSGLR
ncbi:zinc metalloprotease [Chryseobacterium arthrosphaerae]|uniref:Zinc metalloprotease n=1 Tax=Chryseobacterium arthrosphaerae TaxID=651561 RepID=A0ABU7R2E2_9FLAO|nr:zinc metalloprotease [Chryseobacterium arthrosphaerae]MDG4655136.1 zinc metalloprotease [Chryseobacterium arthrosphaerae]QUY55866.1 zinc metalloprotease [Chryseobacterium arthrosphaerae]UEQ75720.1 zinc metalloprotease [Chryseobacterium arthrosphaerae]